MLPAPRCESSLRIPSGKVAKTDPILTPSNLSTHLLTSTYPAANVEDRMSSLPSGKQLVTTSSNLTEPTRHVSIDVPTIYLDIYLEIDGDLYLRVDSKTGGDAQDLRSLFPNVAYSSPVWKTMLFGSFKESRPGVGE